MGIQLSVVIPAYNEAVRIPPTLEAIDAYFRSRGMDYEIIVVDDGSADGTPGASICKGSHGAPAGRDDWRPDETAYMAL